MDHDGNEPEDWKQLLKDIFCDQKNDIRIVSEDELINLLSLENFAESPEDKIYAREDNVIYVNFGN